MVRAEDEAAGFQVRSGEFKAGIGVAGAEVDADEDVTQAQGMRVLHAEDAFTYL
ncbi:hypothetical protein [Streptomyces chartreusis]|uniref:hypothetical protein n=1 Tax=Streptomyces chartreusis TaxID=1969 RepID=UPI003668C4B9